ncbi:MAG: uncharacterized protein A8A55_1381 [Amphiamblys sp. WSBS2006]|nr:MAG: uncharacterized protein A8A55_1381 [Amphiamblys sp. WSBS2006]
MAAPGSGSKGEEKIRENTGKAKSSVVFSVSVGFERRVVSVLDARLLSEFLGHFHEVLLGKPERERFPPEVFNSFYFLCLESVVFFYLLVDEVLLCEGVPVHRVVCLRHCFLGRVFGLKYPRCLSVYIHGLLESLSVRLRVGFI